MDTANKINKDVYDKTISITKTIDSDNDVYGMIRLVSLILKVDFK